MTQLTVLMRTEGDLVLAAAEQKTVKTLADIVSDRDKGVRNAGMSVVPVAMQQSPLLLLFIRFNVAVPLVVCFRFCVYVFVFSPLCLIILFRWRVSLFWSF